MAYASVTDVTTLWAKEPEPEVISLINRRLEQVERMILRRVPDLAAKIAAGTIDVADVVQIEADAVLRVVRDPEGYQSESDGNYSYTFDRSAAGGKLEVLDDEWTLLGVKPKRMFTVDPRLT